MTNPLLQDWDTPFGLPPFNLIEDDHFAPAVDQALDEARAKIKAIGENPEPPLLKTQLKRWNWPRSI